MELKERLHKTGVVPVVVLERAEHALPLARAMYEGGIDAAEVTFRTDAAEESIRRIAEGAPEVLVGAGTVINLEQCKRAVEAGAKFIVSPGSSETVIRYCQERGILVLPGCVTPTEVMRCLELGIDCVKFFPASQYGGLKTIRALAAPFPQLRFVPTGGVSEKNLEEYLRFPKILACGGSWLCTQELIQEGRFAEISRLCREARTLIDSVRQEMRD